MKAAIVSSILAATLAYAQSPSDPGDQDGQHDRKVRATPKSISHQKDGGIHSYSISGLFADALEMTAEDFSDFVRTAIPDCKDFTFGSGKQTCTFTTGRELTGRQLADAIDHVAEQGAVFPYWVELEARDLPPSDIRSTFRAEKMAGILPRKHAWFSVPALAPGGKSFDLPFSLGQGYFGRVLITPATARCMCHSRYSVRILDGDGKVIWKDTAADHVGISVAVTDDDADERHELLLMTGGHEEKVCFRIAPE